MTTKSPLLANKQGIPVQQRTTKKLVGSFDFKAGQSHTLKLERDQIYTRLFVEISGRHTNTAAKTGQKPEGALSMIEEFSVVINGNIKPFDRLSGFGIYSLYQNDHGRQPVNFAPLENAAGEHEFRQSVIIDMRKARSLQFREGGLDLRRGYPDENEIRENADIIIKMGRDGCAWYDEADSVWNTDVRITIWAERYENLLMFPKETRLPLRYHREGKHNYNADRNVICNFKARNDVTYVGVTFIPMNEKGYAEINEAAPISLKHGEHKLYEDISPAIIRERMAELLDYSAPEAVLHIPFFDDFNLETQIYGVSMREDVNLEVGVKVTDAADGQHYAYCLTEELRGWDFGGR